MPSLPELEVYRRHFTDELVGQVVTRVEPIDFRVVRADTAVLEHLLVGQSLQRVDRYGKWLIIHTGAPQQLVVHLGLTGKLRLLAPDDKLPPQTVVIIHFQTGTRLVLADPRHLGKLYVQDFEALKAEKSLGPDLLELSQADFVTALQSKHRGVRDVLMDQKIIAGIGGKYADEILWQAKLNPHSKLDSLSLEDLGHLYQLTRDIIDTAISLDAQVERFPAGWLIPHRRTDNVCPRCHHSLTEQSSAFSCPHCQPEDSV
jgi:formamidopyrimidine-DNA glycosylase